MSRSTWSEAGIGLLFRNLDNIIIIMLYTIVLCAECSNLDDTAAVRSQTDLLTFNPTASKIVPISRWLERLENSVCANTRPRY